MEHKFVYSNPRFVAANRFALGEQSYSVVPCMQVNGGVYTVGGIARAKTGAGEYDAVVTAIGEYHKAS